MHSLANAADRAEILRRLSLLRPETPGRWGRMTAPQMVCHLTDAFRGVMGERPPRSARPIVPRWRQRLMKLVAIQLPLPWPHGTPTTPDADQERGGTPPGDFRVDVAELVRVCERFATSEASRAPHYFFGDLSNQDWSRWGYKHMDHHLRQFGL
jgi:hypothetical protein